MIDRNNIIGKQDPLDQDNNIENNDGKTSQHPENDVLEVKDLDANQFIESSSEELQQGSEEHSRQQPSPSDNQEQQRNMPSSDRITEKDAL